MNIEQKLTPKYWAAHDSRTDDVILSTLFKYKQDTYDELVKLYGEDWEDTHPNLTIDLIELKLVQL
ncbi:hypothetical protein pEaSNUABM50_00402 [Erwinia phage pEa_SNUABM_50]|uniref:Uncharacterized protein n=4 Tax=Eneladusvirus BF TaxID=2560751 RepID=A0A7L8ZN43_9CAUD|nr:hypothetical protein FDH34_gp518 [Serratia phage BF]QOI71341.1 hypothetical protein pEaSNUABM12_00408 [Erwinia phage pEa_SNUABM_12]QOI71883.1 hypothetical protein pEaSNUABM47_00404 [Erwinia phage pEa_SNUABM_47]QOI72422.1 hypothetical protein pEaSNUABM50_00402 [Erwinia phage pEa_SNUABM_50]QXO11549.1 hypothetical protein pEaSNUABM19_00408 [Erwinia phage pEa_SNUABM_19]QXO12097.1 hypothetical protein pEaSNUABM44_00406 [Erwinia phage pEa_SNUABM_44]